jgi:hydrogenase maturation protease
MIKIIAIGNILMGDDAIGIVVLNNIKDELLNLSRNIEVIIGETDFIYCLNKIDENDFVIILDSTYLGLKPGEIIVNTFDECINNMSFNDSHHDLNLIRLINKYKKSTKGFVIGIEAYNISYNLEISNELKCILHNICINVINEIRQSLN